jgi:hypothetical protein
VPDDWLRRRRQHRPGWHAWRQQRQKQPPLLLPLLLLVVEGLLGQMQGQTVQHHHQLRAAAG